MGASRILGFLQRDWLRAGSTHLVAQAATLAAAGFQGGSFRPAFLVNAAGVAATPALLFGVTLLLLGAWRPRARASLMLTACCASLTALLCIHPGSGEFRERTLEVLILAAPAAALLVHRIAGQNLAQPARRSRPREVSDQVFLYLITLVVGNTGWLIVEMEMVSQQAVLAVPIAIMLAFPLASFMALPFIVGFGLARKLRPDSPCPRWHPALAATAQFALWLRWVYTEDKQFGPSLWMLLMLPLIFGLGAVLCSRTPLTRSPAC